MMAHHWHQFLDWLADRVPPKQRTIENQRQLEDTLKLIERRKSRDDVLANLELLVGGRRTKRTGRTHGRRAGDHG